MLESFAQIGPGIEVRRTVPVGRRRMSRSRRRTELDSRRQLLRQVSSRTIKMLGPLLEGAGADPSGRAYQLREENRLFGVRAGWRWHYPEFQFDAAGWVYPEITAILIKLPDEAGWSRLRWFLTPHSLLGGRAPLQVWNIDRGAVARAASAE